MLEVGLKGEVSKVVQAEDTAARVASGLLEVFSTPMMIALMEKAAYTLAEEHLEEEESTVGVEIGSKHMKATPIGVTVKAVATITKIEGRFITFQVQAFEEDGTLIGEGTHLRCIINRQKFIDKLNKR
ncbi:MAG TPA: thioesterase family protein [Fusobacterium sp.]|uniref:thioesterase family protein n=1 Tax=Fusobacterium sp. TaxID=68766 RepID=UPI002F3E9F70